jgi:murein DD-endopeptidase MepM/ murein hydrolase activator NlpD
MTILNQHTFARERGAAFYGALLKAGLSTIFPGDSLVIVHRQGGSLITLSLLSRLQYWYTATERDSGIIAEKKPIVFSLHRCLMNGVLETSLLDAMQEYGIGPALACKLADIFAWDINFFLDPRKGDTFQILYSIKFAEGRFSGYGDILAARYHCKGKDFYAIGFSDSTPGGTLQYYDQNGKSVQKEFLKAPLRYSRISSFFSYHRKHPILGIVRPHFGIDYAAPYGTPVYAAADGTVMSAGWDGGYGNAVTIAHGGAMMTCYGHMASISSGVRRGAHVAQGQMIGTVGATGLATGPHLDYRMKKGGAPVNPLTVSLPSKNGIEPRYAAAFNRIKESCLAAFVFRSPQRLGNTILDIEHSPKADSDGVALSQTYPGTAHGVKSSL